MNFLNNFRVSLYIIIIMLRFMLPRCKMVTLFEKKYYRNKRANCKNWGTHLSHLNTLKKLTMKFSVIYKISNVISNVISNIFVTPYTCDSQHISRPSINLTDADQSMIDHHSIKEHDMKVSWKCQARLDFSRYFTFQDVWII